MSASALSEMGRKAVPPMHTIDLTYGYYEHYVGPYFTSDGRVDLNVAQQAVDAVAIELGVAAASVDQMYQPAL